MDNIDSALVKLGEADFYGLAALEVCGSLETRLRWEVIEPWHLYQPLPNGPVFYNEQADTLPQRAEELDALALVQNAMDPDVLRKKAAAIAGRLYEAMQTGKQPAAAETESRSGFGVANPLRSSGDSVQNKKKDDHPCHDKTCQKPGHGGNASIGSKFSAKTTLGTDAELEKLGGDKGELFIEKKILKKLIGAKKQA